MSFVVLQKWCSLMSIVYLGAKVEMGLKWCKCNVIWYEDIYKIKLHA